MMLRHCSKNLKTNSSELTQLELILRSRQDSNLRGETLLDFKSNALTTRPRLLYVPIHIWVIRSKRVNFSRWELGRRSWYLNSKRENALPARLEIGKYRSRHRSCYSEEICNRVNFFSTTILCMYIASEATALYPDDIDVSNFELFTGCGSEQWNFPIGFRMTHQTILLKPRGAPCLSPYILGEDENQGIFAQGYICLRIFVLGA